jgi:hypothetical protein
MATEKRTFGTGNHELVFVDRRAANSSSNTSGFERRQFSDGHQDLSPEAAELGRAIDQYKLINRRRYITYDEMLGVIKSIGYTKD